MRPSSYLLSLLAALLLLSTAGTASASGVVDPKIVLGGTGSCQSFDQTSFTQVFSGVKTNCLVDFSNDIISDGESVTLFQLVVTVAGGPFSLICDGTSDPNSPLRGPAFQSASNSCTFTQAPDDAITPGLTYSLTLGPEFGSTVNLVLSPLNLPEPGTLILFGTGLMAYAANKRRQKNPKQSL